MGNHQHVMYASRGSVEQVYSELFGDINEMVVEEASSVSGTVDGKLGQFLAVIRGEFSGEITESEIKSINFDEEMLKAKRLANEILADKEIPRVSEVVDGLLEPNQLYRFSGEVSTKPFERALVNRRTAPGSTVRTREAKREIADGSCLRFPASRRKRYD